MTSVEASVKTSFTELARTLCSDEATVTKWTSQLISRYSEPQRYYHTINHIHAMLQCLDQFHSSVADETTLKLAIFFHDWIYDPKSKDNEIDSIQYLRDFATDIGLLDPVFSKVASYIERTITHTLPTDVEESNCDLCLFLDFDLEVLSRNDAQYLRYSEEIRAEYSHFKPSDYYTGRLHVLTSFLGRDRLYFSNIFYNRREQKARANLEWEIGILQNALHPTAAPS
ncbi:hypothetical protein CPB84DRAFT_1854455 [Gymnopilus junonius]|uniref:Metal-dependent HD superfamily phosphohydrolase n=1 Tax=Gymnopilus junonius TaxID=109634 RepID=A0A9P5NAR4_GYMJU|nr:hypothetical protein CPB84DRAFT_1854455 [Gymnopilus junonius]